MRFALDFFFWLTLGEQVTGIWHQKTSSENFEESKLVIGQGFLEKLGESSFKPETGYIG